MDLDELKDGFMLEAVELLEEAEDALLDYSNTKNFEDSFNKVFRSFHSLKGAAGMFGLDILQEHMHKVESQFEAIKESFTDSQIDYFLSAVDAAREFFESGKIEFSYIDSGEAEKKPEKKEASSGKDLIYVVDDEKVIVDLLCEVLDEAGYETKGFYDGKELLADIDKNTPGIILSDINMPEVDGLKMIERLNEMGSRIPVVFISAFVTKEAVMKGLEGGVYYFIEKPFDENNVLQLVHSILKNEKIKKLLNRSMDYVLYQFSNQEEFMIENGKERELNLIKSEIHNLIELKNSL